MVPLSDRVSKLGEAVAEVSDRAADRGAIDAARRRFLAPAPVSRRPARSMYALAATLCLACLTAAWVWVDRSAVAFHVGASTARGAVGSWVAAVAAPLDVRFSEGSTLTLAPGARMRVTKTSAGGAEVLVERGEVHASIVHVGRDTRWALHAGPFEVRVTGTAFDASWDPATETFELRMREGSVVVSGPLVPPGPRRRRGRAARRVDPRRAHGALVERERRSTVSRDSSERSSGRAQRSARCARGCAKARDRAPARERRRHRGRAPARGHAVHGSSRMEGARRRGQAQGGDGRARSRWIRR